MLEGRAAALVLAKVTRDLAGSGSSVTVTRPAGPLFGRLAVLLLVGLLGAAVWFDLGPLAIAIALLLSSVGFSWLWSRLSMRGLQWQRVLSHQRAFPGEEVEVRTRIENHKLLPLPWVEVTDHIPPLLLPDGQEDGLTHAAPMRWYQAIEWRHRLICRRRGYYLLGPAMLSSGDPFGLYPRERQYPPTDALIVYPRLFPLADLGLPSAYPLGELRAHRRLFQDPTRPAGIRAYAPGDPLKHIHWKATAHLGDLQVRVFEPTTTLDVVIVLAMDSFGGSSDEDVELAISGAASVAYHLVQMRSAVGLLSNAHLATGEESVALPPRSGQDSLVRVLEALALVTARPSVSLEEFLHTHRRSLPWGTTLLFVLHALAASHAALIRDLRVAGYPVALCHVVEGEEAHLPMAIPRYRLWHPGALVAVS